MQDVAYTCHLTKEAGLQKTPEKGQKSNSGSGTLPDEKRRTERERCLENHRYLAAAQQVIAEDAQLATSLGRGHADLSRRREFLHVSDTVQDFTSVIDTQGLGQGHALTAIQNNANANANADVQAGDPRALTETDTQDIMVSKVPRGESERTPAHEAHDVIDMRELQRLERVEKALDKRTEQEQDISDENANVRGGNDQVNETNEAVKQAGTQKARQAKDDPQADRTNPSQSAISEILKQQDRVLQMSQNGTVNQMEAQAVMAQLSARIDQLIAQQRQLHGNWRRLRMEDQNRTQQNMGDY